MPNYNAHIEIAKDTADLLGSPLVNEHLGYFYLGCTAPDIRIITKKGRQEYHFAPLDFQRLGDGIEGLFHAKPHLSKSSSIPQATRVFVSGYLTHIIADEIWILQMYRPHFGNPSVFADSALGDLMDRALQLEMDNKARTRLSQMSEVRRLIEDARNTIDIDFISRESLSMWRNWLLMALHKEFNWERLRFMAKRMSTSPTEAAVKELSLKFLASSSIGLQELYSRVPESRVSEYRKEAIRKSAKAVGDYLS